MVNFHNENLTEILNRNVSVYEYAIKQMIRVDLLVVDGTFQLKGH